jgi:hypothetical protein
MSRGMPPIRTTARLPRKECWIGRHMKYEQPAMSRRMDPCTRLRLDHPRLVAIVFLFFLSFFPRLKRVTTSFLARRTRKYIDDPN